MTPQEEKVEQMKALQADYEALQQKYPTLQSVIAPGINYVKMQIKLFSDAIEKMKATQNTQK